VRHAGLERAGAEAEALGTLDAEAGGLDRRAGVAGKVAPAGDLRPEPAAIGDLQDGALGLAAGDHVLVEAQLSAGAQDAAHLRQRGRLIGDAAQRG
jgi:hypothetical protein